MNRKKILKVVEAIFNEESGIGIYGISLVENPAMEDCWITLKEEQKPSNDKQDRPETLEERVFRNLDRMVWSKKK